MPLALQLQLGCVAFCSCKRHVVRACPAAPPVQQTLNLWIPAAPGLQQQQQLTSFLASCSGCSTALHCTPATHLKYRIDRQQQQQQSRPWVLRSNGGPGADRSWRKCVNQSAAARPPPVDCCCSPCLNCCCTASCLVARSQLQLRVSAALSPAALILIAAPAEGSTHC